MLHLTSSGRIEPCDASVRSCPLAPSDEHFKTVRAASRALALEALERQGDLAPLPEGWGSIARNFHLDEILRAEERTQITANTGPELTADAFKAFAKSDSAKRPAEDRGDWRGDLAERAESNGDLWSDQNPDTSVSGYWDSTPNDDDEDDDWGFEDDDAGSLLGTVGSLIGVVLLISLALALFNRFDGDILSILTWAGNGVFGFISWIAGLFAGNSFFQQAVR